MNLASLFETNTALRRVGTRTSPCYRAELIATILYFGKTSRLQLHLTSPCRCPVYLKALANVLNQMLYHSTARSCPRNFILLTHMTPPILSMTIRKTFF